MLWDVTAAEVAKAPEAVRQRHLELLAIGAELLPITDEALALLAAYEFRGAYSGNASAMTCSTLHWPPSPTWMPW